MSAEPQPTPPALDIVAPGVLDLLAADQLRDMEREDTALTLDGYLRRQRGNA